MTRPRILYIAGTPHCGSTLLDIMLGAIPGVFSTGELSYLPHAELCATGVPIHEHELWSSVLSHPYFPKLETLHKQSQWVQKEKGFLKILASKSLRKEYAKTHDLIYDVILEKTNSNVIVDSSKYMTRALSLVDASKHDIRVLHLIRDPRGQINSLNWRHKEKRESSKYAWSMAKWFFRNSAGSLIVKKMSEYYLQVFYEDFMQNTSKTLYRIGEFIETDVQYVVNKVEKDIPFSRQPLVNGNRMSTKEQVLFDPSRLKSNKIKGVNDTLFWYTLGWLSSFWGYERRQQYLHQK